MENRKLFYEDIKEIGANGLPIESSNHEASEKEIEDARELHRQGKCPHTIIYDDPGWMYDLRYCGICGAFRGLI